MCRRILFCSLVILLFLSKDVYSESTNIAFSKGEWTRLLDGAWYVQGYSHDRKLAYLTWDSIWWPKEPVLTFESPLLTEINITYINYCPERFNPLHIKALDLSSFSLDDASQILYEKVGKKSEGLRFALIEPGNGVYMEGWPSRIISPDGNMISFVENDNSLTVVDKLHQERSKPYSLVEKSIIPQWIGGDSEMAFNAYVSLLANENLIEVEEGVGSAFKWILSLVGWISDNEILYLSNRTTDLKRAWLEKDQDWQEKIRWSLWRMDVTNWSEKLIWDSKELRERVLNVSVIPNLRLIAETKENFYVIDRNGGIGSKLSKEEWTFPTVVRDPLLNVLYDGSQMYDGTDLGVSHDGSSLIAKKKGEREELWVMRTDGGGGIRIPDFPPPFQKDGYHFSFSPDANRLAYFTIQDDEPALVVMEVKDPPSFRLYKLDDPEEVLEPKGANGNPRIITWIGNDALILPAIRKKDRNKVRKLGEYSKFQSSWLLKIKEEVRS